MKSNTSSKLDHKLIRYGVLLFLLGLITGVVIPIMQNPRMGLSSHLEGVQNGMLLMLFGLIWPKLDLSQRSLTWVYFLALYGTYTNWFTTFLAGIWGAGSEMMPIAGLGFQGLSWQELLIKLGLFSLSVTMIVVCGILLFGLRGQVFNKQKTA
jgi:hydroxylaminobenzene mutase